MIAAQGPCVEFRLANRVVRAVVRVLLGRMRGTTACLSEPDEALRVAIPQHLVGQRAREGSVPDSQTCAWRPRRSATMETIASMGTRWSTRTVKLSKAPVWRDAHPDHKIEEEDGVSRRVCGLKSAPHGRQVDLFRLVLFTRPPGMVLLPTRPRGMWRARPATGTTARPCHGTCGLPISMKSKNTDPCGSGQRQ